MARIMKPPVVVIGMGELGGVFARAFLKAGHPVYPVTRSMDILTAQREFPDPVFVLVAVAENDLSTVLETMPGNWRYKIGLLQNELLPSDWQSRKINDPTVVSVWFEKKRGQDYNVFIPSPIYGPNSRLTVNALSTLDIPCRILSGTDDLLQALVIKNVYVLTINIAGLMTGGTVGELWAGHNELTRRIAGEVIVLQERLTGAVFDREALMNGMLAGIEAEPAHQCRGRSSSQRLGRVIALAERYDLGIPAIREIHANSLS